MTRQRATMQQFVQMLATGLISPRNEAVVMSYLESLIASQQAALFALTLNLIVAGCAIAMLLLGWLSYALDYARRYQ